MKRLFLLAVGFLVFLGLACSSADETLKLSPFPTATAISTATAVAPTATVRPPTPTITPLPPTLTPPPIIPIVEINPPTVAQGKTLVFRVWGYDMVGVDGAIDNKPLFFVRESDFFYWSVVGIESWAQVGKRRIDLKVTYAGGNEAKLVREFEVMPTDFLVESIVVPSSQVGLLEPSVMTSEKDDLDSLVVPVNLERLWRGTFKMPTEGFISSPFGARRSYSGGSPGGYHEGVDLAANQGSVVLAANRGRVVWAGPLQVRGIAVVLDHGLGVYTGYYHLAEVRVQKGQMVVQGEIIGAVGQTGLATGPHLHWEIKVRGINVDPLEWLQREMP